MKTIGWLVATVALVLFSTGLKAQTKEQEKVVVSQERYTHCFEVIYKKWGDRCDSKESFEVRWKNVCPENMDLKYAIRKKDGSWEVGIDFNVAPNEETVKTAWTCSGTGHYIWWARPSDKWMDIKFPTDDEIQKAK